MKWEITTTNRKHTVLANSSADAVQKVKEKDSGDILSCKLLPRTVSGKAKRIWSKIFGK